MKKWNYICLKSNQMWRAFKELKNPISSFLFYIGRKDTITVKSRKLGSFTFNSSQKKLYNSLLLILSYLDENNIEECKSFYTQCLDGNPVIDLGDYKVVNKEVYVFSEKYAEFPYSFKNIKENDVIVDIGSNVGDTALGFANDGLIVYGFEPVKDLYEISLENVELNPKFKDKINLFNFAISYKKGTITIEAMESTSSYIDSDDEYEVEVITIGDIFEMCDIKPRLLKMDCEGCEFDIIKNTDMSVFDEIIFEHHASFKNENYLDLVDILKEQGFNIDLIPLWSFNMEDYGIIHAYK